MVLIKRRNRIHNIWTGVGKKALKGIRLSVGMYSVNVKLPMLERATDGGREIYLEKVS
jgi:hypothetical protein